MQLLKLYLALLALLVFSSCQNKETSTFPAQKVVNQKMDSIMEGNDIPGLVAIAVNKDGEKIAYTYGKAIWDGDEPVITNNLFRIASMARLFRSIPALQLVEKDFADLIEQARKGYLKIPRGKSQDKAVDAILDYFRDEEEREEFYKFFRQVRDIYDIISPDAFMRPYQDDYENLCRMYKIVTEAYNPSTPIDRAFSRKTASLVQSHSKSSQIKGGLEVYEINEHTIEKIEESEASDTEKIFNLVKGMDRAIREQADQNPILIPIGERAASIVEQFKQKQKGASETLKMLKEIINEYNEAKKAQAEKNMSTDIFMVYWQLKQKEIPEAENLANNLREVFDQHPHWHHNDRQERTIRQALYKELLKHIDKEKTPEITSLVKEIMKNLKVARRD